MSNIPEDLMYAKTHEWARDNGDGSITVGISDHAQEALGDLVFVEMAEVDHVLAAGDPCCVVESVKAASDVYAPLDGTVIEANAALEDSPELVNSDPYGEGWLFRINVSGEIDQGELLDAAAYADFLATEE